MNDELPLLWNGKHRRFPLLQKMRKKDERDCHLPRLRRICARGRRFLHPVRRKTQYACARTGGTGKAAPRGMAASARDGRQRTRRVCSARFRHLPLLFGLRKRHHGYRRYVARSERKEYLLLFRRSVPRSLQYLYDLDSRPRRNCGLYFRDRRHAALRGHDRLGLRSLHPHPRALRAQLFGKGRLGDGNGSQDVFRLSRLCVALFGTARGEITKSPKRCAT